MRARPALLAVALLIPVAAAPAAAGAQAAPPAAEPQYQPPPPPPYPPPPPQAGEAPEGQPPAPPAKPKPWRLAVTFGAGSDAGGSYFIFGGSLGYQPVERFELFLDGQYWTGSSPSLGRLAAGANWYPPVDFSPYLGGYFARWFASGNQPDQNAVGVHGGIAILRTRAAVLLAGVAWEHALDCTTACDAWWPELSAGVRF